MSVVKHYIEAIIFKPPQPLYTYPIDFTENDDPEIAKLVTPLCLQLYDKTGVPCICATHPSPKYWVVYSHGNSESLQTVPWFIRDVAEVLHACVFAYDYPGYYKKIDPMTDVQVQPSEKGTFDNAEKFIYAIQQIAPLPVILLGYSLGTAPTLHAAEVHKRKRGSFGAGPSVSNDPDADFPHAVALLAPFVSAASVVLAPTEWSLGFTPLWQPVDVFCLRHAALTQAHPIFVSSGGQDAVVPPAHGKLISKIAGKHARSVYVCVPEATHSTIRVFADVWTSLVEFLDSLKTGQ